MVFHWSLSDSKSPQVSKTLLSILAVLNDVVVWMVSTRPPTSKSSTSFSNPLVTVPTLFWESFRPALADGFSLVFCVTLLFSVFRPILIVLLFEWFLLVRLFTSLPLSFLWWIYRAHQLQLVSLSLSCFIVFSVLKQGPSIYHSFRFLPVLLCGQPQRPKSSSRQVLFLFFRLSLTLVVWPRLGDPFVSQNPTGVSASSFSKTDSWSCIYPLFVWSNFNFLHNSQWISFPSLLCLVLYTFCADWIRLLCDWS